MCTIAGKVSLKSNMAKCEGYSPYGGLANRLEDGV